AASSGSSRASSSSGLSAPKAPAGSVLQAIGSAPVISEAPTGSTSLAEGIRNNSVAPESLRKPYASLAPHSKKSRSTTSPNRSPTGPRPPLESFPGLEDELTSTGQTSQGQPNSGATGPGQSSSVQPSTS